MTRKGDDTDVTDAEWALLEPVVLGKKHKPFIALQAARLMTVPTEKRREAHTAYPERLCQADPAITKTYELAQAFVNMLRKREEERLDNWIAQVEGQGVLELRAFAAGLLKDYDAVKAASRWNGVTNKRRGRACSKLLDPNFSEVPKPPYPNDSAEAKLFYLEVS